MFNQDFGVELFSFLEKLCSSVVLKRALRRGADTEKHTFVQTIDHCTIMTLFFDIFTDPVLYFSTDPPLFRS